MILNPYKIAVRKHAVKILMEKHNYTKQQARQLYSHVTDDMYEKASNMCGVDLKSFSMQSVIEWIKAHWVQIIQVACSIIGLLLMFIQPMGLPPINPDEIGPGPDLPEQPAPISERTENGEEDHEMREV